MKRHFLMVSMGVLLSGCSGLLHSDDPVIQIYYLRAAVSPTLAATEQQQALNEARNATASPAKPAADVPPTLQVPRPQADPGLATELITLIQNDHRMDHYAASSWPGALPEVVETLAIDTLRASGHWSAVHDAPSPFLA